MGKNKLEIIVGSIFIIIHIILFGFSIVNPKSLEIQLLMVLVGVGWQIISARIMDNLRLNSETLEDFVQSRRIMYKLCTIVDAMMLVTVILVFFTQNFMSMAMKLLILGAYTFWVALLLFRDILSLKDLTTMKNSRYRTVTRVVKVSKIDKHLINNKYTIWYLNDKEKRKRDSKYLFKIGKCYRLELIDIGFGSYIVDFEETTQY